MKRLIIIALLLCAAMAQGQRFEWAKGYDSSHEDAFIQGSVTDSLGNLYILGNIHWDSDWDTIWLMPHLTTQNTMVMVAKISPEGEMVWRKIYGSTSTSTFAMDIKALGDTGFAVMFTSAPGSPENDIFYWGDSVYHNVYHPRISPYDTPGRRFDDIFLDVYVSFDYDGNVTEEHLLERSYVDSDGNDVVYRPYTNQDSLPLLHVDFLLAPTFDVDVGGNVYICYTQNFYAQGLPSYLEYNGTVGAMRYWVDHRLVGESAFDSNSLTWYPILLKFSPHFDTLLASRYLVANSENINPTMLVYSKSDGEKIYLLHHFECYTTQQSSIIFDSVLNYKIEHPAGYTKKSIMLVLNYNLELNNYVELRDSIINPDSYFSNSWFRNIDFDKDSGLIFISGFVKRNLISDTNAINSLFMYRDDVLPLNNSAFVLILNKEDYSMHSLCRIPSKGTANLDANTARGNLVAKNNRVFLQAEYYNEVGFPNHTWNTYSNYKSGLCFGIFDYRGNVIEGHDYALKSTNPKIPGPISLRDSNLYLMNFLTENARFGSHRVNVSGYKACVAQYVDTAFMSVYRPPLGGIAPGESGPEYSFYPNPVENKLQVDLDGDRILQATAVSVLGVRERLGFAGNTVDVSHLRPGVYVMELTTIHNTFDFKFIKR